MEINYKEKAIDMFDKGMFGTKVKTWFSLDDLNKNRTKGLRYVIRYKGDTGCGYAIYNVSYNGVLENVDKIVKHGADPSKIYFNEFIPEEDIIFQGEVLRSRYGLTLTYSTEKVNMRKAMQNPRFANGVTASFLLKHFLTPSSHSDLMAVIDLYPDSVIEFTTLRKNIGDISGRNTIVWEVRNY